jgi:uncharacterized protein DUF3800
MAGKPKATKGGRYHIYSDESSQHGGSAFTAIGATFLRNDAAEELASILDGIATENKLFPVSEFHWTEMQKVHLEQYKKLVTCFTDAMHGKQLRYHCVLIENRKLKPRDYSGGDRELTLLKLSFGPVYSFASRLGTNIKYYVYPDSKDTKHDPDVMLHCLNNRARSAFGVKIGPFRTVCPTPSENSRIIQATDVITGAIAFEKNEQHLKTQPKPAAHKMALWEHVKKCTTLDTLAKANKGLLSQRFAIWEFDFSKAKLPA